MYSWQGETPKCSAYVKTGQRHPVFWEDTVSPGPRAQQSRGQAGISLGPWCVKQPQPSAAQFCERVSVLLQRRLLVS